MKQEVVKKGNKKKFIVLSILLILAIIFLIELLVLDFKIFTLQQNVKEGEVKALKVYPKLYVQNVSFSDSNQKVLVASGNVYIFDTLGNELWTKAGLNTNDALFIESDKYIITTMYNKSETWNEYVVKLDTDGNILWKFESGLISYDSLKVSKNGKYIAIGSTDKETGKKGFLTLLDKDGNLVWRKDFSSRVESIDIIRDGSHIIVGTRNGTIYFLNSYGEILWQKNSNDDFSMNKVRISPNDNFAIFGMNRNYTICVDISGNELWKINTGQINNIAFSDDSKYIAIGTHWGKLFLIRNDGKVLWKKEDYMGIEGLDVSSRGEYIAIGAKGKWFFSNNYVVVYDVQGNLLWKYEIFDTIFTVSMTLNGEYLVAGTRSSGLIFLDNFQAIKDYARVVEKKESGFSHMKGKILKDPPIKMYSYSTSSNHPATKCPKAWVE